MSEEAADGNPVALGNRFFLVDPLDGTKEFIKKRSDFTVNIALIEQGRPSFGLVYAPARSLLAVTVAKSEAIEAELAPSSGGADLAKLHKKTLAVRAADPQGLTALVSLSHLDPETEAFLAKLKIAKRSGAGSSVKFLEIARGEADVYPRFGPTMEWDTAAGQAVLEASGGRVVTTNGDPLRYGKRESGLRNPSFIAWGASGLRRLIDESCGGEPHGVVADVGGQALVAALKRAPSPANSALAASSKPGLVPGKSRHEAVG